MKPRSLRIALVHDTIYPFVKGGAPKRFWAIGRCLARRGYDVHLYGMKSWPGPDVIEQEGMTLHGISKERRIYTRSGRRSVSQALLFGLASFKLWREPFDIMDCCGFPYFSLFPARLITWLRHKRLYSTWHEVWGYAYWREYLGDSGILGYAVERLAARLPDTIIAISDSTKEDLCRKLKCKRDIRVIPNGIDFELIQKVRSAAERTDIIYAGRLLHNKNIDLLLQAAGILIAADRSVTLTIIGEGPEKGRLEKQAGALGLRGNVRFKRFFDREEDLYAHLSAAQVFVLPSTREGFGIVAIEANACGLPVITIDHPRNAARALVEEGKNGLAVPFDKNALAAAIRRFLDQRREPDYYRSFVTGYDWDAIIDELEKIYLTPSPSKGRVPFQSA